MNADVVLTETVRPGDLARLIGVHPATVWNWINKGVTIGGRLVTLPAKRIGWKYTVTPDGWERFKSACNPDPPTLPETPAQEAERMAAAQKAAAELLG